MASFTLAGVGEILWDVVGDAETLGGAPMNFAWHAQALGATGHAISTVGDDKRGDTARELLLKQGVNCAHISVLKGATTGYVLARVDRAGIATYTFPDNVAWDNLIIREATMALAEKLDAVCFGALGQRSEASRRAIRNFIARTPEGALKVFDMNIRQSFYSRELLSESMEIADVVKLNDDEIVLLRELEGLEGSDLEVMNALRQRYHLTLAVLTRGDKGSLLVSANGISDHPGIKARIVDTIGAGDSFTAATVLGLLQGRSLDEINRHANEVAALVCSRAGAMVVLPDELKLL